MTKLKRITTDVMTVPTDYPEADGTFAWTSTTMVLVRIHADSGEVGLGYSYTAAAAAKVVHELLEAALREVSLDAVGAAWEAMVRAVRNVGHQGLAAAAISAVDVALWDLRAKHLGLPLFRALESFRDAVPIYGSGGFTSYDCDRLIEQLGGWVADGIPRVKMKIGTDRGTRLDVDRRRILSVREAIGPDPELFVDANGAYTAKQAISLATDLGSAISYFEEPVSSDHLGELALVRRSIVQDVAAGEYGWDPWYFRSMMSAGAVDILQADATRCLGVTGFLEAARTAHAFGIPFSAHTSPSIHAHAGCAAPEIAHVEYFYDHARIEGMLFDGAVRPEGGFIRPDPSRPGLGLEFKERDAERYRVA